MGSGGISFLLMNEGDGTIIAHNYEHGTQLLHVLEGTKMVTRKASHPANHEFEFTYGKVVKKKDIPPAAPNSVVSDLPIWEEVEKVLTIAKETGVVPFEEVLEYDIKDFPTLKKLKQPRQSFLQALRARVTKHGLSSKIEVQSRKDRMFLVVV